MTIDGLSPQQQLWRLLRRRPNEESRQQGMLVLVLGGVGEGVGGEGATMTTKHWYWYESIKSCIK